MPAIASIEDLKKVETELKALETENQEFYNKFSEIIAKNNKIGYKNICYLIMKKKTAEELKGM